MAQVLVLASDRELGQRLTPVLTESGCTTLACDGRAQFHRRAAAALSAVIAARELGTDGWITWLAAITADYPELPLVVVTTKDPDNLRLLAQVRVHAILYPSELDRLPALVRRQPIAEFFTAIDNLIQGASHLPLALRRAIRHAVNQVPRAEAAPGMQALAPARTVKELAARLNYNPAYLSHLASEAGVLLGPFLDSCIALRGIELRIVHGLTIEQAAWRLGFEHPSGLSDLCLRAVGRRPSKIQARDLAGLFALFDARFCRRLR